MSGIINVIGAKSGSVHQTTGFRPSSFMASHGGTPQWQNNMTVQKMDFNNVAQNQCFSIGGDYDTSEARYTAPSEGTYIFCLSVYTGQTGETAHNFCFRRNNTIIQGNSNIQLNGGSFFVNYSSGDTQDQTTSASCILRLAKGDYMEAWLHDTSDWYEGHSGWYGARIS